MKLLFKKILKTLECFVKYPLKYPKNFESKNLKFDVVIHYLTLSCNSRCITCNIWKIPRENKSKEIWTLENFKTLYSTLKTEEVYLTGGEPTLISNFCEMCEVIYRYSGAVISFTTNGLATQKIKKDLLYLKKKQIPFNVSFSCNGFQEIHDFSRGIAGNYKKILDLIRFCYQNNIQPTILYTIFPFNIDETIPFVKYWKQRGVDVEIGISRMDSRYNLEEEYFKYTVFGEATKSRLFKILEKLVKIYPEYMGVYYLVKHLKEGRKTFPCFGLVRRIVIDSYGNVYPCDGLEESLCLGNLRDTNFNFEQFCLEQQKRFQEIFKIIRDKKCQPCPYICDLLDGIRQTMPRNDKVKIIYSKIKQKMTNKFFRKKPV